MSNRVAASAATGRSSVLLGAILLALAAFPALLSAQSAISTFPYQPTAGQMASDFSVNSGSGASATGSSWTHGAISGSRRGKSGAGCDSWACRPGNPYNSTTVSWLDSPTFDVRGQGAMVAEFYLWVRAKQNRHGLKLMVSTDGGSTWEDCQTTLAYNGNTNSGNALSNAFGGSNNCWNHNTHGGSNAKRVQVSLIPYRHCSALRFRWCFASDGDGNDDGPVIDSFMLMSMDTVSPELYQGTTEDVIIDTSGFGEDLTHATGVIASQGITVNSFNVVSANEAEANVTISNLANAGPQAWEVERPSQHGGNFDVAAHIVWPTDILPITHDGEPSRNPAVGGVNVFLANGEFFKAETDLATRGRMMGINWSRFYASRSAYNGPLGQMWMGHYYQRAIRDGTTQDITWYTPDLRTEVFAWNSGSSRYDSPAGVYIEAEYDSGIITLTDRHGFQCEFNADGRLEMCTDRNGNSTTCTYNADGQLITITDDRGFEYTIEYYQHGRVERVIDNVWSASNPREVVYGYNTDGQLISQKAPETDRYADATSNRTTYEYTYDANHRMLTCKNPREVTGSGAPYLTNTYENGWIIQQQLGTSGQNIYLRYESSTLVHEVDRRGVRTDYTLDGSGRATAVERFNHFWQVDTTAPIDHSDITKTSSTDIRGNSGTLSWETTLTYNSNHEVTSVTMPRGNSVEYTYQSTGGHLASGNLTEIRRKDNALGSDPDIVEEYTYESSFNFVETHTDARGNETTYSYDIKGNLEQVDSETVNVFTPNKGFSGFGTTSYQITTTATYNAFGQIETITDGEGNVTSFAYYTSADPDQEGFLKQRIVADNDLDLTTEYDYNRAGFTIATWGPRAFESGATKDNFKISYTVNELGQTTHVQGRRLRLSGTDRPESYSLYDLNGNLERGFTKYVTWNGSEPGTPGDPNNPASFTKSNNPMTATWIERFHSYNLLNYATAVEVDAIATGSGILTLETEYFYDNEYNQITTQTPLGFNHTSVIDERGLVFQRKAAAGETEEGVFTYDHDDNGNVISSFDALNNETTYLYDGFDRTVKVTDPEGHYRTTEYDPNSNVTRSRAYNVGNTLLSETEYTYDELNRVKEVNRLAETHTSANIGDGLATSKTAFDKNSRVVASMDDNGVKFHRVYDGANRLIKTEDHVGNKVEYTLNAEGAMLETKFTDYNQVTMAANEVSHVYQDLDFMNRAVSFRDQRFHATNMDTEVFYHYDSASRTVRFLDAANTLTASEFDLLGRTSRVTRSPGGGTANDIVTDYEYDADSRNTLRRIWNNPGTWTQSQDTVYEYDKRNRLKKLIRPSTEEWTFSYNAQNRTGWTDPLGTSVSDTYDDRNLVTQRLIERGTGVLGVTREEYEYDGLGRLTRGANYEEISSVDQLHVDTRWEYNTLSLPEKHYQEMEDGWAKTHSSNTFATYDATGFNTGHTYYSGRTITYNRDSLNRVASIVDNTFSRTEATFYYAGRNRLIRRDMFNGTKTIVEYEDSGCGCGGFTALVESVRHEGPLGQTLYREERRYDVNANATAQRWEHLGNVGNVYRYDSTYRMTDEYEGVNLQGSAIDTYANPANTPTAFNRHYTFDTRGNRTLVEQTDASSSTVYDISYSPDADTNVYNTIDGESYTYDDVEQMTFDPTRGIYMAYDYMGRLIAEDTTNEFTSPEKRYRYDVHSRLRVEETNYKASYHNEFTTFTCCAPNDSGGVGCGGEEFGYSPMELIFTDSNDDVMWATDLIWGPAVTGLGSASTTNPAMATLPVTGGKGGKNGLLIENKTIGDAEPTAAETIYRHEGAQRSLLGATDIDGFRELEGHYSAYGMPYLKNILWDGSADDHFDGINWSESELELVLFPSSQLAQPITDDMVGAIVRVANPDESPYVLHSFVIGVDTGNGVFYIDDPSGDIHALLTASGASMLTVFDNHDANIDDGQVHTAGTWEVESINYEDGVTTFTNSANNFPAHAVGWTLQPDANKPIFFPIVGIASSTITVLGDLTGVAQAGDQYFILHQPGIDKTNGAVNTNATEQTTRFLAFGYQYITPMVGVDTGSGIEGRQGGNNLAGQYQVWNRNYLPDIGRWTTTDPAASPWSNLIDYVGSNPSRATDPTGLFSIKPGSSDSDIDLEALERLLHGSRRSFDGKDHYHDRPRAPLVFELERELRAARLRWRRHWDSPSRHAPGAEGKAWGDEMFRMLRENTALTEAWREAHKEHCRRNLPPPPPPPLVYRRVEPSSPGSGVPAPIPSVSGGGGGTPASSLPGRRCLEWKPHCNPYSIVIMMMAFGELPKGAQGMFCEYCKRLPPSGGPMSSHQPANWLAYCKLCLGAITFNKVYDEVTNATLIDCCASWGS